MSAHKSLCNQNPDGKKLGRPLAELTESQLRRRQSRTVLKREKVGNRQPKMIVTQAGRVHSQATKDKISIARTAYLTANPDKVPYLLNHYTNGPSYPEIYFDDLLTAEGLTFTKEHRVGLYSLDFAFLDQMIDLEINGSQHYDDPRIVESDIRRKAALEALGWTQIVVDWRAYQKFNFDARSSFILDLLKRIKPSV